MAVTIFGSLSSTAVAGSCEILLMNAHPAAASTGAAAESVVTRPEYYRKAVEGLDPTQRRHVLWQAYSQWGLDAETEFTKLNPEFADLALDPGMVFHLEEFKSFIKGREHEFQNAESLREAFRNHLGLRKVYRALYITQVELDFIKLHGIPSLHLSAHGGAVCNSPSAGESVALRLCGLPPAMQAQYAKQDIAMSVTDIPAIAAAVVYQDSLERADPNKFVVMFEIEVPWLDTVWAGESYLRNVVNPNGKGVKFYVNNLTPLDQQTIPPFAGGVTYGREVESFIFYEILPSEIKSWRLVKDQLEYEYERGH